MLRESGNVFTDQELEERNGLGVAERTVTSRLSVNTKLIGVVLGSPS